ncbi:MAG: DUF4263 domain-containing protein [Deltaproteobacteria bacterium]|nr:DUF4263 domain-containing protein [Deltaproteobacteria bacterium]
MAANYPPELSVEDIKVKIQATYANPNIGKTHQVVLKDGPRTYRIATIFEILDPAKGELHHLSLQLDSFDKTRVGWRTKPEKKICLDGENPDEINALSSFLNAVLSEQYPKKAGEFHVISKEQYKILSEITLLLPQLPGSRKLELFTALIGSLKDADIDIGDFVVTFQKTAPEAVKNIGIAARFVQYKDAFTHLKKLVEAPEIKEPEFQSHLKKNPWIFGSEYSELLDRRKWTRDQNFDFMLRRTVDGYLEIIEIKTAFSEPLFRYDSNHNSYYSSSKLSQVMGQTFGYIEEVERNRDSIIATDKLDPLKIRARIFIGRDGDENQQAALRTLNSHLHRVEVMTFDQLIRVAQRTLDIFQNEMKTDKEVTEDTCSDEEDFPF